MRSRDEHYAEADRLLAECANRDAGPYDTHQLLLGIGHALLATAPDTVVSKALEPTRDDIE
jgi:hypothetical protein